jgi:cytochrome b6-f complex iron-sulfur subunit
MNPNPSDLSVISRRRVLASGVGGAVGLATLAACGGSNGGGAATSGPTGSSTGKAGELVKLADVPVGGAVSATDKAGKPVIVSQPTAGKVVAFSAVCTHRGCTVAPQEGILKCPCHGSTYDIATGDNTGGPAPRPLADLPVTVSHGVVKQT